MKYIAKVTIIVGALMIAPGLQAQGLFGVFKKKDNNTDNKNKTAAKVPVQANPYAKDFSDELGIGGAYNTLDTIWIDEYGGYWDKDGYTKKKVDDKGNNYFVTTIKLQYTREKDDNIVNLLSTYPCEFSQGATKSGPKLDEKVQKAGLVLFSAFPSAGKRYTYMQLDKDIIAYIFSGDNFENAKILNVFAKDKGMLSTYDKETALAKMQQLLNKSKEQEFARIKEDLMKNETFSKMKGKVGFVTHYNQTGATYGKISEKPDVFISSVEIGKPFYWRAYYDIVPSTKCGDGCSRNMIFEIDGQKVSYMELRKKSSTWSGKLSKMSVDNDFFSMCPTMIESKYTSNWAFVYCLYLNKAKFADGKSLKCTVTITNYRDGVDQDVLAQGSINLVYKSANQAIVDELMLKAQELDK